MIRHIEGSWVEPLVVILVPRAPTPVMPLRLALERLALVRTASVNLELPRFMLEKLVFPRLAPVKFTSTNRLLDTRAKHMPVSVALVKSVPLRMTEWKVFQLQPDGVASVAPMNLAPVRST